METQVGIQIQIQIQMIARGFSLCLVMEAVRLVAVGNTAAVELGNTTEKERD